MKKISIVVLAALLMASCKKEHPKNYITLSGKINGIKDTVQILGMPSFMKKIAVNSDGSFKDTLKVVKKGRYALKTSKFTTVLFLANGYDLTLTATDAKNAGEHIKFKGAGAVSNNFIQNQMAIFKKIGDPSNLFSLDKVPFDNKVISLKKSFDGSYESYKGIDSTLLAKVKQDNKRMLDMLKKQYPTQHTVALERAEAMKKLAKGNVSPKFVNYKNVKGGKTSLENLKGKYVYVDLWATWCGPCKAEIPALKKLEAAYEGKNITFISISLDNKRTSGTWDKAEETWKKMVADKKLSGLQLFAGKDDSFVRAYQVNTIPRFILIDPKGNIVNADAPRPSDTKIKTLFKELGI